MLACTAGDGTAFGEQALINEDCIRTASIVTEEPTDLIVINRELYNRSIASVRLNYFLVDTIINRPPPSSLCYH
jgi:hypothetical protein